MMSVLITGLIVLWVLGGFAMYFFQNFMPAYGEPEPFWFQFLMSFFWPIVVPLLTIYILWNNYQYDKRMKKK